MATLPTEPASGMKGALTRDTPRRRDSFPAKLGLFYGVKAVADFMCLSEKTARLRIDSGTIPNFRIGGTICARRSSLTAWLEQLDTEAAHGDRH